MTTRHWFIRTLTPKHRCCLMLCFYEGSAGRTQFVWNVSVILLGVSSWVDSEIQNHLYTPETQHLSYDVWMIENDALYREGWFTSLSIPVVGDNQQCRNVLQQHLQKPLLLWHLYHILYTIYNIISPGFVEQGLLHCVKVPKLPLWCRKEEAECSMFQVCVNLLRGQNSTGECLMVTLQTFQSWARVCASCRPASPSPVWSVHALSGIIIGGWLVGTGTDTEAAAGPKVWAPERVPRLGSVFPRRAELRSVCLRQNGHRWVRALRARRRQRAVPLQRREDFTVRVMTRVRPSGAALG